MTFLIWLRVTGDLAFYYSYASFFVALSGSAISLPGILIPSLVCALSRLAGDRRLARIVIVLPAALILLLPMLGVWDRIAFLPAFAYAEYLAWTGNYSLSHDRQTDVFLLFGKSYPIFFAVIALTGGFRLLTAYSLPPALLTLVVCVFLLRVLRHEAEVYTSPRFLLQNLWILAAFVLAAWLMHLKAVTSAVKSALLSVYDCAVVPVLRVILYGMALVISFLFTPLLRLFSTDEVVTMNTESGLEAISDSNAYNSIGERYPLVLQVIKILVIVILAALVCALLIRLFRRFAGGKEEETPNAQSTKTLRSPARPLATANRVRRPVSPLHPVNQVRRQYRRYLGLCHSRGYTPNPFSTSRDILHETISLFPQEDAAMNELRILYLRARYQGEASREDAVRAAQIVDQLRSSL